MEGHNSIVPRCDINNLPSSITTESAKRLILRIGYLQIVIPALVKKIHRLDSKELVLVRIKRNFIFLLTSRGDSCMKRSGMLIRKFELKS